MLLRKGKKTKTKTNKATAQSLLALELDGWQMLEAAKHKQTV